MYGPGINKTGSASPSSEANSLDLSREGKAFDFDVHFAVYAVEIQLEGTQPIRRMTA